MLKEEERLNDFWFSLSYENIFLHNTILSFPIKQQKVAFFFAGLLVVLFVSTSMAAPEISSHSSSSFGHSAGYRPVHRPRPQTVVHRPRVNRPRTHSSGYGRPHGGSATGSSSFNLGGSRGYGGQRG